MSSDGKSSDGYKYDYVPASRCYNEQATTQFADLDMDQMKAMVINAKPEDVHNVARGWRNVNNDLVGEDGSGGSRQEFLTAVNEVLEHWEGDAADRFKERAGVIAQKMQDGAKYAEYASVALSSAATVLEAVKPEVMAMKKPGKLSSAVDFIGDGFSHDDSGYQADKRAGMSTQQALEKNKDDLSAGKEAQLRMAVKMEELGAAYMSQSKAMRSWNRRPLDPMHNDDDYPGHPGGTAPTPIIAIPTENGPKLMGRTSTSRGTVDGSPRSVTKKSPGTPHSIADAGKAPSSKALVPSRTATDTNVDGIATERQDEPITGGGGGHAGGGRNRAGGEDCGVETGAGLPASIGSPAGGLARGSTATDPGFGPASRRFRIGGAGSDLRTGGQGPLTSKRGGMIHGAEEAPGAGAGAGLHGSRSGTTEGRKAAGLTGSSHAGVAGHGRDKKKSASKAVPGYLVEDEETWEPKGDITNPRVID